MKVNAAGGLFHSYGASGPSGTGAGGPSALGARASRDQVTLSKQVLAVVQMQNRLRAIEQAREDAKNSPEAQALESMRKALEVMKVCNKIAARIRAGDTVPLKDLRYLMKHDMRAYQLAMASRKPKEDPKKWDSAVPRAEQENRQAAAPAVGAADGAQACAGSECSSGGPSAGGTDTGGGA